MIGHASMFRPATSMPQSNDARHAIYPLTQRQDLDPASYVSSDDSALRHVSSEKSSTQRIASDQAIGDSTLGLPADRATTLLPPDLLQGGEIIILLLKPSVLFILINSLRTAVVVTFGVFGLWLIHDQIEPWFTLNRSILVAGGLMVIALKLLYEIFNWLSRVYVLTNRRVIRVKGVIHVEVFESKLNNLQHTQLLFSFIERLFGLGTIGFATSGSAYHEAYWEMLARPLAVHRKLIQTINQNTP